MTKALDIAQVALWTITYVLIVLYGFKYRKQRVLLMPLFSGSLNFAWEINALYKSGMIGQTVCTVLDVIILIHNIRLLSAKKRIVYTGWTGIAAVALFFAFNSFGTKFMLVSSFVIDTVIAVEYLVFVKKIARNGKILIGITRTLGDAAAWLAYAKETIFVGIAGAVVLILNLLYLSCCFEEESKAKKEKGCGGI